MELPPLAAVASPVLVVWASMRHCQRYRPLFVPTSLLVPSPRRGSRLRRSRLYIKRKKMPCCSKRMMTECNYRHPIPQKKNRLPMPMDYYPVALATTTPMAADSVLTKKMKTMGMTTLAFWVAITPTPPLPQIVAGLARASSSEPPSPPELRPRFPPEEAEGVESIEMSILPRRCLRRHSVMSMPSLPPLVLLLQDLQLTKMRQNRTTLPNHPSHYHCPSSTL
mmetsp:Transcript_30675/g.64948  ORF Transcript_30675/g.64948 Transcript_30675/m.64948 type:complete len:223 (+) Transcript_30675:287-955(+)